jgi:glycosyltransferase involved in cell wall biosynthesis
MALEGVGTFLFGLCRGLSDYGWQIQMLIPTLKIKNPIFTDIKINNYKTNGLDGIRSYRRKLKNLAEHFDCILLVENNPTAGWLGDFKNIKKRVFWYFYTPLQPVSIIKQLGWCRQGWLHGFTKNYFMARWQDFSSRRCIVATKYQARQLRKLKADSIYVIPGAPIPSRSILNQGSFCTKKKIGWDQTPIVGYLGHFSSAKGVETLLAAMTKISQKIVLAIAYSGKGRLTQEGLNNYKLLKDSGRLRECGVVDPIVFLSACDVVALPYPTGSIHHLPLVLLEAYAAATPVITTDVGGLKEIHHDGLFGKIVPPNSPSLLGMAIEETINNPTSSRRKGMLAHSFFNSHLSGQIFCRQISNILKA